MKIVRRSITGMLTLLICFTLVPAAFAHPLGNFTINHYAGLHISRGAIVLDYVMDMAEIAAFQEIELLDANGNLRPDVSEADGYHAVRCASLKPGLSLFLNNKAVTLSLTSSSVQFPAGVGGLPTMRLTCQFEAPLPVADSPLTLSFHNQVFADRLGWQEIVVVSDGVQLQGEYSSTSLSKRLTDYPQDLLTSPLEQREVQVEISATGFPAQDPSTVVAEEGTSLLSDRNDAFTRLILLEEITLPALLLALAVSFLWGAMHAMTPGHGKTIVGAYLVGSRGTMKHALYLGLTTTITHTLGVFGLGLITLFAAQYIVPETLYPWMSLLSGLLVVGIGINLLASRLKSSRMALRFSPMSTHSSVIGVVQAHKFVLNATQTSAHTHTRGHSHIHPHTHSHVHRDAGHSHTPPEQVTWRSLLALGISGGLIPCPSALVVMLGAIALNKIGFGLMLVLAFSLGLAGALTAIGMLFIYAGRLFARFPSQGKVLRLLPVLSAFFVSALGALIIWKALGEMGIV